MDSTRACRTCGVDKPISEFYVQSSHRGRQPRPMAVCKPCHCARSSEAAANRLPHPPLMEGVRLCTSCGVEKSVFEFEVGPRNRGGRCPQCKACRRARYQSPGEGRRGCWSPEYQAAYRREHRYRLTPGDYDQMVAAQKGRCAICARLPDGQPLQVDHCHDAEAQVRGLLCTQCNVGLGMFQDDPGHLQSAIAYLETWGQVTAARGA